MVGNFGRLGISLVDGFLIVLFMALLLSVYVFLTMAYALAKGPGIRKNGHFVKNLWGLWRYNGGATSEI